MDSKLPVILNKTRKNVLHRRNKIPNIKSIFYIKFIANFEQIQHRVRIFAIKKILNRFKNSFDGVVAIIAANFSKRFPNRFSILKVIQFGLQWSTWSPCTFHQMWIFLTKPDCHCGWIWTAHQNHATSCIQFFIGCDFPNEMSQIRQRLFNTQILEIFGWCCAMAREKGDTLINWFTSFSMKNYF